jgi:hypothetical protein
MKHDPRLIQAKITLGIQNMEELQDIALTWMDEGYMSENIVRLVAINNPTPWDYDELVPKIYTELSLAPLSKNAAVLVIAQEIAKEIVSGKIPPIEGSIKTYEEIWKLTDNEYKALENLFILSYQADDLLGYEGPQNQYYWGTTDQLKALRDKLETEIMKECHELLNL